MTTHEVGRRIVAHPEQVVGATGSGRPETREGHDSMSDAELARFRARRRFLRGAVGAGALFFVGGVGAAAAAILRDDGGQTGEQANQNPNTNTGPAFEKDLALRHMAMPETLDPPTFEAAVGNLGQAIQYAVNNGDVETLRRLIPGGQAGVLQPGQFELRAAFIEGYRKSSVGTANDNPNNPNDTRYYPWGFRMELIEPLSRVGANPTDPEVTNFTAKVRIVMGDLPPLVTGGESTAALEPQKEFEADVELTRFSGYNLQTGRFEELPNINGQPGRGWGLANVSQMYPVPSVMTGQNLPKEFTEVPPLYVKS